MKIEDAGMIHQFQNFASLDRFVAMFTGPPRLRRPICAIVGGTNTGKSMIGADVLRRVGEALGLSKFLEVTVEDDGNLDLSELDVETDAGVLLDGVGDAAMLTRHREALQGRAKSTTGGRSATMLYAYPFTLASRAVVATFDLSAENLDLFNTHHWLKNPANVMVVHLTEPAWVR